MPYMHPLDFAAIDSVSDAVNGVADNAVASLNASRLQSVDQYIGYSFAHSFTSVLPILSATDAGYCRRISLYVRGLPFSKPSLLYAPTDKASGCQLRTSGVAIHCGRHPR